MHKKSYNSYLPGEQTKRDYGKPFDENVIFGKPAKANFEGTRVKKLLIWPNTDPNTIVNSKLAAFIERTHAPVGALKNLNNATLYMSMTHGKVIDKRTELDSLGILSDCPLDNNVMIQRLYLKYINSLRRKLKKNGQESLFSDIFEEMLCFDKDYSGILPEEKVFSVLEKNKVYMDKIFLMPLLDALQIHEGKNIKYRELLNLLNWKYDFPTLPRVQNIPKECQHYDTTYGNNTAHTEKDTTNITPAGITYANPDGMNACNLIAPNIFTRHGVSVADLRKPRDKAEIRNIFEAIGVRFPNDSFELLWKEGSKQSGTYNVSVESFRNLLDDHDDMITKEIVNSKD